MHKTANCLRYATWYPCRPPTGIHSTTAAYSKHLRPLDSQSVDGSVGHDATQCLPNGIVIYQLLPLPVPPVKRGEAQACGNYWRGWLIANVRCRHRRFTIDCPTTAQQHV